MHKRQWSVVALIVALCFVSGAAWATGVEEAATTESGARMTGLPIVDEPITLRGFGGYHPQQGPFDEMLVFQEMEKRTNIQIEWEIVPDAGYGERQALKLATGDLPDFFYRLDLGDLDVLKYGAAGVFVDMNTLTDYSPNLNVIFARHPEWKLESADGGKYTLGNIQEVALNRVHRMWVNQKFLDNLSLPMPTTTDEYLDTLLAFRDGDPNGNGRQDEVGLADFSTGTGRFVEQFLGAWGLGTRGNGLRGQTGMDVGPDGNLRYIPISDGYREILEYLNLMWEENLIDPDHFAHSVADWQALGATDRLGSHPQTSPAFMHPHDVDFAIAGPLIGPYGDQLFSAVNPTVVQPHTFAITSANPHPEATMRWVDYFFSEDGYVLLDWGVEGVTYQVDENGIWDFIRDDQGKAIWAPDANSDWPNKGPRGVWTPFHGGRIPILWSNETFQDIWIKSPIANNPNVLLNAQSLAIYEPYFPEEILRGLSFTEAEAQVVADYMTETGQYVNEMEAQFMAGQVPFSEWDDHVAKVKSGNFDQFVEVVTAAYNRYVGN